MQTPLFRPEVLKSKRSAWYGQVLLLSPPGARWIVGFALASMLVLMAFLFGAQYTKRVQVSGLLMPTAGLIEVRSAQPGLVLERRVEEGQQVHAGDILYVISGEVRAHSGDSNAAIVQSLRKRQDSLADERGQAARMASDQAAQLTRASAALNAELQVLDQEIATQARRVNSAEARQQRNAQMASQGFLSGEATQRQQDELLDQQGRLQSMQRTRVALVRELEQQQAERSALALRQQREQNQLGRQSMELEQQSLSAEVRSQFVVTAPQAGTVGAVLADPGQRVDQQTLLTLLPAGAQLEAQLYVPTRAAGFIEAGQQVAIRYPAYPFQKFGQHRGQVAEVSRTALSPRDLPEQMGGVGSSHEGMYRVRVRLARQDILAYGKPQALSAGMLLEADVLQDRRTLLEWLLEPVYSLKGKL